MKLVAEERKNWAGNMTRNNTRLEFAKMTRMPNFAKGTAGVATDLLIVKTILVGATAKISENEKTLNDMQNGKRKFMGDIRITFFVSICKLSRFKHPYAAMTSPSELSPK